MIEDKLRQAAGARIRQAIDAQDALGCSEGSRPGRGAGEAVRDLTLDRQYGRYGSGVAAASTGCFDHLDQDWRLKRRALRLEDRALLGRLRQWRKAGMLETAGRVIHPESGTPPGGVVSPVRAKVSVHDALDRWLEQVVTPRCRGAALLRRSADDRVCALRCRSEAAWFDQALPKRRGQCTLAGAPEKTRIRRFRRFHPGMTRRFTCLGCEFCWHEDRQGAPRVNRRTARQKWPSACQRSKAWRQAHRPLPGKAFCAGRKARWRGHYSDYGVHGNANARSRVLDWAMTCAFQWLNRRGGKRRRCSWQRFTQRLDAVPIARPRLTESRRRRVYA